MIISATHLRISGIVGYIRFIFYVRKVMKQLDAAEGLLFVKFKGSRTVSGWESQEAMDAFRNKGTHLESMKNIRKMGRPKSTSWESELEPDWKQAQERLDQTEFR